MADVDPYLAVLTRIAVALEALASGEEQIEFTPECQHPLEAREDFGMTRGEPDWYCNPKKGGCGKRSIEAMANA